MISQGLHGRNFDAFVSSQQSYNDDDVSSKLQEKYWQAKQKFLEKIKKKEDECIVLSDAKLDAKLEVFRAIDKSCEKLIDVMDMYQNCLYVLANDENYLGRFLRDCSKQDKTKAGKVLATAGKAFTFSSHQRIQLYGPLLRLYHEIETFHSRAVDDTLTTVDKLEKSRTQYRSSLLWMKDISTKLDPDTYRQLEKFRKVQNQVRQNKGTFDRLQLDTFQKIDLLMASRCNLINQVLAGYQKCLLQTFEKNTLAFENAEALIQAEDIYDYEFKTLKDLNAYKSPTHSVPNQKASCSQQGCDPCSEVKADDQNVDAGKTDKNELQDQDLLIDTEHEVAENDLFSLDKNNSAKADLLESLYSKESALMGDMNKIDDELSEFLSNKDPTNISQAPTTMKSSKQQVAPGTSNTNKSEERPKDESSSCSLGTAIQKNLIEDELGPYNFLADLLDDGKEGSQLAPESSSSASMDDLFSDNLMLPSRLLSSTENTNDLFSLLDPNDPGYNISKVLNRTKQAQQSLPQISAGTSCQPATSRQAKTSGAVTNKDWLDKLADLDPLGDFELFGGTNTKKNRKVGEC